MLGRAIEAVTVTGSTKALIGTRQQDDIDSIVPQRDVDHLRQTFKKLKDVSAKEIAVAVKTPAA